MEKSVFHSFCGVFFYSPEMAESSSFDVEEGDIILLGTDGLFDNMNEDMILDCLSKMKVQKYNVILQFHAEKCMYIIIRSPVKAVIDTLKNAMVQYINT